MLFRSRRSSRSTFLISMVASLAFIALAIWGWGADPDQILNLLGVLVLLGVGLIVSAAVLVALFKLAQKLFRKF